MQPGQAVLSGHRAPQLSLAYLQKHISSYQSIYKCVFLTHTEICLMLHRRKDMKILFFASQSMRLSSLWHPLHWHQI